MDQTIADRLNAINRDFYQITATEFDQTRGQAWPGWNAILAHLPARPLSVCDVGCGNGRFGVFLAEQRTSTSTNTNTSTTPITYHGLDNSAALLAFAQRDLAAYPHLAITLETRDLIESPPMDGQYDLVGLFGVIHHIPGADRRKQLMMTLADRVKPGGILVFAAWCFYEFERFRSRIVAWPDDLMTEVEHGDYLLDWRRGETALRYCHYVDETEHAALIAATGLQVVSTYRADGFTGTVNRYSILAKT
ncbi:MAG: class I SAM-dependent methyltransferase [Anaerolineae bacterium]|jgi:SAM-dependent methyltransferase|nr:class I SAM-dependent methyltransferase [Anaerolineae bacterium]